MKKFIFFLCLLLIIATGCSTNADIDVQMKQEPTHMNDELTISVEQGGEPLSNLEVIGTFEMAQMDHGTVDFSFEETDAGIYNANLELPMPGEWVVYLTLIDGDNQLEHILNFDVPVSQKSVLAPEVDGAIAAINGDYIMEEDLEFYQFINLLQVALYRESDKQTYEGEDLENAMNFWDLQEKDARNVNSLLTQIIRLRAVALLSLEKGHEATQEEIDDEVNKIRQELEAEPIAKVMIEQYGENKFWNKQLSQYELIVLANKVQQDMIDSVREENPEADNQEVNFLAQKQYEDLLVSQVESLDIDIYLN
ncbi:FixH family protein [Anaerobacillus sp. MEB173]|uniref:FixH family protein n=1 Tax=Anaerobacillus sp. MEB173 TaxID=3383345 RepID=UPI003F937C6D